MPFCRQYDRIYRVILRLLAGTGLIRLTEVQVEWNGLAVPFRHFPVRLHRTLFGIQRDFSRPPVLRTGSRC
jgi:hypothetical protein